LHALSAVDAASSTTAEIDGTSNPSSNITRAGLERPVSEWDLSLRVAQEQN